MVLEMIAIDWIINGWDTKNFFIIIAGITVLILDVGSDMVGIPT